MDHAALVEALGGPLAVAGICGVNEKTPYKWPIRGIPAAYWPALVRAAAARGLTVTHDELEATAPQYPIRRKSKRQTAGPTSAPAA